MPDRWASMRSTAKCVLPVLVGPRTATTRPWDEGCTSMSRRLPRPSALARAIPPKSASPGDDRRYILWCGHVLVTGNALRHRRLGMSSGSITIMTGVEAAARWDGRWAGRSAGASRSTSPARWRRCGLRWPTPHATTRPQACPNTSSPKCPSATAAYGSWPRARSAHSRSNGRTCHAIGSASVGMSIADTSHAGHLKHWMRASP